MKNNPTQFYTQLLPLPIDQDRGDDKQTQEDRWEVVVRPPKGTDEDPREIAERLFTYLHAHGRLSYEIHSNPDTELKVIAGDEATAETVARHVRSEVGQLHHLLDTFAADDVLGVYQIVCEPVEGDWTARRSRSLPESVPQEQDTQQEMKRAGAAMVPVFALSLVLSPWPLSTSLIVGCALVMAATVGEGVRVPQYRDRTKEQHGARSSQSKKAEKTADEIIEQAAAPGWRASIRLVVSAESRMVSADIRDSLVAEIESAFSSSVTGQSLSATRSTGSDAREILEHVQSRHLSKPSLGEIARLLGRGTRRDLHVGPGEFGVLGYFPDVDGDGSAARELLLMPYFWPTSASALLRSVPVLAR